MMKHLLLVVLVVIAQPAPAPIFRYEADGFWLNLHHFLYVLGRAEAGLPDSTRRAVADAPADQEAGLKGSSQADQQIWRSAVTAYAKGVSRRDLVFDKETIDLTNATRRGESNAVLEQAAPIYRKVWWPHHQKANHARVADLQRLVEQHGEAVLKYITRVYQQPWEPGGYPVNMSAYSNWAGAYSTRGQLLVFASLDEGLAGVSGLEIMFHEAMHQWDDAIFARLAKVAREGNRKTIPGGLTHAMIFYTAGEAVRSVLPSHATFADVNGIWTRGSNNVVKPALDAAWKPYLDGKGTLDEALRGLLEP